MPPVLLTVEAVPLVQRLVAGGLVKSWPADVPQTPPVVQAELLPEVRGSPAIDDQPVSPVAHIDHAPALVSA